MKPFSRIQKMNTSSPAVNYPVPLPSRKAMISAAAFAASLHLSILYGIRPQVPPTITAPPPTATKPVEYTLKNDTDVEEVEDAPKDDKPASTEVPILPEIYQLHTSVDILQDATLTPKVDAPIYHGNSNIIPTGPLGPGDGTGPRILNTSEVDLAPRPVSTPAPRFPNELKKDVSRAEVRVTFVVNVDGTVSRIRVLSSPNRGFDDSIEKAMRHWRFKPGMKKAKAVPTRVEQTFIFTMSDE